MTNSEPTTFALDAATERRNGRIYAATQLLTYFSAPVLYVGVVQAAFCDKLGASTTVANLPNSAYLLGAVFPLFCAWLVPARLDQRMVRLGYGLVAALLFSVCCAVFLPAPNWLRIAVVIGQGLLLGVLNSTVIVYLFKSLARATSETGRARALKFAFGFGPVAAVAGSLLAQAILAEKIPGLVHPYNFGTLYLIGFPCLAACSFLAGRLVLAPPREEPRQPFTSFLGAGLRDFWVNRRLRFAWVSYLMWYVALGGINNLSLYTRNAVGRSPLELAGLVLALRFGLKSAAGFGLGTVAERLGARPAMLLTLVFLGLGLSWPFVSSGYVYLLAFGLMGAGELGGIYFSNYIISVSPPEHTTRNVSILALVGPVSSVAPALHGYLADTHGFPASFGFGLAAVAAALILQSRVRPAQGAAS